MAGSTEPETELVRPLVLVSTWRRRGKVWGEWERDIVGTEAFYVNALQGAGLAPLLAPVSPPECAVAHLAVVRGLVVIGGEDVHPSISGADPRVIGTNASAERDRWELSLLEAALEADLPILAICRGMQLLNILHGGTLQGDIADVGTCHPAVPAQIDEALAYRHDVAVNPESLLGRIYGVSRRPVNSLHHQAIGTLGNGLSVSATAPDGTIEAVEPDAASWCAAMQWHPELLGGAAENSLFQAFSARCRT